MDKDLLRQVEMWHKENAHMKIIAALSAEAWQDLDFEGTGLLARAYNNVGQYEKAISRLSKLAEQGADDALWNFRMGYAYYYNEQYDEALKYLQRACTLDSSDKDTRNLLLKAQARLAPESPHD